MGGLSFEASLYKKVSKTLSQKTSRVVVHMYNLNYVGGRGRRNEV
jgi:hypothetical protein